MKRIIAYLAALCILLSLSACVDGNQSTSKNTSDTKEKSSVAGSSSADTKESSTDSDTSADTKESETSADTSADTKEPETSADTKATDPSAASDELRGTIEGDAYVNKALGVKVTCPENWIFFTEDQMAMVNGLVADQFKGSKIADLLESAGQVIDMMATDGGNSSINVVIQKLQAGMNSLTDEKLFQLQETTAKAQLASAGMEIKEYEIKTMKVGGEDRTVLRMVVASNGTELEQYQVWYRGEGNDLAAVVTISLGNGAEVQPILDGIMAQNS